jgi:hypothetical protein
MLPHVMNKILFFWNRYFPQNKRFSYFIPESKDLIETSNFIFTLLWTKIALENGPFCIKFNLMGSW